MAIGVANTAKGEKEEAPWYRRLSDYASAAGDKFFAPRVPNCIGGVHLELFDLDEAIWLNLEGAEVAQQRLWPELRSHSLLKVGLAHPAQVSTATPMNFPARLDPSGGGHLLLALAYPAAARPWELALAEGRYDEAWTYATQSSGSGQPRPTRASTWCAPTGCKGRSWRQAGRPGRRGRRWQPRSD